MTRQMKQMVLFTATVCLLTASLHAAPGESPRVSGYGDPIAKPTGRFELAKVGGRDLLVTPEGRPFVALGINHMGNIRGSGPVDWNAVLQQIRQWGCTTIGNGGGPFLTQRMPHIASLNVIATSKYYGPPGSKQPYHYADFFDPQVQAKLRQKVKAFCEKHRDDPLLVGYCWTDTPCWDLVRTRALRTTDWVSEIRKLGAEAPGKIRYVEFLKQRYQNDIRALSTTYGLSFPSFDALLSSNFRGLNRSWNLVLQDDQQFLGMIARQLYRTIGEAQQEFDPTHLVFGEKYLLGDCPDEVLQAAAPYIDILSIQPGDGYIDVYPPSNRFDREEFDRLHRLVGKPIFICDHQISFATARHPETTWTQLPDEAAAAVATEKFIRDVFARPFTIGYMRCQYINRWDGRRGGIKQGLLREDKTPYAIASAAFQRANEQVIADLRQTVAAAKVLTEEPAPARPNVLFIAVDDLNDWVGFLAGHPQVKTPNMDRLARKGVVFANAHCAAPLCCPSRAAVFSGKQPFHTGVYNNRHQILKLCPDLTLLPKHFEAHGYRTLGTGKLLHRKNAELYSKTYFTEQRWSPFTNQEARGPLPPNITLPLNGMPNDRIEFRNRQNSFDWGPVDAEDHEMGDGKVANWAVEQLLLNHDRPFFLAVGFYRPHTPLFVPRKYFDLYPTDSAVLPEVTKNDLEDLNEAAKALAHSTSTAGLHKTVLEHGQWKNAVAAYLACVSFIDAQVGKILDVLEQSPHAENTIVILWSDHGWHLGEKEHWGKSTCWERSTRVPLVVVPAIQSANESLNDRIRRGVICQQPVGLIDLYPTLIDMCGLSAKPELDGRSLLPLLLNPEKATGRVVVTTLAQGVYSARDHHWRLIRYADGTEELYDHQRDPNEWTNLTGKFLLSTGLSTERSKELSEAHARLAASIP